MHEAVLIRSVAEWMFPCSQRMRGWHMFDAMSSLMHEAVLIRSVAEWMFPCSQRMRGWHIFDAMSDPLCMRLS